MEHIYRTKGTCVRSYMTIEEVRSLIATPMQNEGVKSAYLLSLIHISACPNADRPVIVSDVISVCHIVRRILIYRKNCIG